MSSKVRAIVRLFIRTLREWQRDNGSLVAAGLAFFAIFSLAPMIIIAIAIVGQFFEQSRAKSLVLQQIASISTPETAESISAILQHADQAATPASIIGGILLLWAASRIFAELQRALNMIWQSSPSKAHGFRRILAKAFNRVRAISMTIGLGGVLITFFVLDLGLAALQDFLIQYFPPFLVRFGWPIASFSLSLGLFMLIFALVYKWLPEASIAWRDVWVGAFFSSLMFAIGRYLISLYFRFTDVASPFGVAGSVVVVLVWIYYSMQILLFGAEFTWVYANRRAAESSRFA